MDFPFIKCIRPRRILNRYSGEYLLVECGKCEHCRMKKSMASTIRCKLECAAHRFTYFVTLTYSQDNLPCARLIPVSSLDAFDEYTVVREDDGLVLGNVQFPSNEHKNKLIDKCKVGFNRIPILYSLHAQLFLKRLRKRLNEKIRVYYCGEYGPKSYRPHFHFLIWFDEEQTLSCIGQAIRSSWTFGRVDSSLASGKASSYVSTYLNGNSYLPKILKLPATSPFSNHSWYLGEKFLQDHVEAIKEKEYSAINRRRVCRDGINADVLLWRSFKNRLFPKLKGSTSQSEHVRVLSYSAFSIIRDWTQENCPINQARFITDFVRYGDFYHEDNKVNDLLQLFRDGFNHYEVTDNGDIVKVAPSITDYNQMQRIIYHHILQSRYFLKVICGGDDSYDNVLKNIRWIDGFYNCLDSENLKNQLQLQSDWYKNKDVPLDFWYHNILNLDSFKDNTIFKAHEAYSINLFGSFCKHKELNDLNKIFNY